MIKYQVFNVLRGQYTQVNTIEEAQTLKQKLIDEFASVQNKGVSLPTNEFLPYNPELANIGITKEKYNEDPFIKYKPYSECTDAEKTQLDAEKETFKQASASLFVINKETIDENGNSTWVVFE